ncbi:TIGR01777 family oxidoreductase [Tessaracoccus flavus]|uniref:TIGR01777 family protein n=1 Tax=Tessaracoccus flavus TaxID=1610493 RepID=A0A1Q2CIA1_9ACTN|nr:TIGR01777 family oxidoreductase [Tessaracoccus flavus]AQP45803.1 TIGR01777 family protein [Tessaracoccus flavus]SDZ14328.1 hypothetical protein SAMN05428934_1129 [Tessaracoccus flavus]
MNQPIERASDIPFPRERVFDWWLRPGSHERLSPPGWGEVIGGDRDARQVGDTVTLQPSHPLMSAIPGASLLKLRPVTARLDVVEPGERIVVALEHGRSRWTEETRFTDSGDGGTRVEQRVSGDYPASTGDAFQAQLTFLADQAEADLALVERLAARPSRIVVAGSSGLIGTQLVALLKMAGHDVTRLVRGTPEAPDEVRWDPASGEVPTDVIAGADAVVNLAGHTIGGRFTDRNKKLILQSRVDSTSTLANALRDRGSSAALIQASGIGFYGARRPAELLTEESRRGSGFLADVVDAWEAAAAPAVDAGVRTVFVRTGIALSYAGGALQRQVPLYLVGAGGRLGKAQQYQSWIGIDDLVRAYVHALFTPDLSGPINAVAPNPVTNAKFAETLGKVLQRPSLLPTPSFGPKLIVGDEGYDQLIDTDQRVSADKLLASGFEFTHPTLEPALRHTLLRQSGAGGHDSP